MHKSPSLFFTQKLYLSNLWITFFEPMDQPEDHLWILRGADADLERLLLVLSLGPQFVSTVLRGAKGLVEM